MLQKAKALLEDGGYTCVLIGKDVVFTSKERGIGPLLSILNADMGTQNAYVADKVVGKAAAFLYTLMGIKALYASTLSVPALQALQSAGIAVEYGLLTQSIRNRTNTGQCPMEQAVWEVTDAQTARRILEEKVQG